MTDLPANLFLALAVFTFLSFVLVVDYGVLSVFGEQADRFADWLFR